MVEGATIRMRLHSYRDMGGWLPTCGKIPLGVLAMEPQLLHLHIEATPADVAGFSEVDPCPAYQTASTAVAIEILSGSDTDNQAAGGHAQSVNIIGTNGSDKLVNETQLLHATAGTTVVTSSTLWKEVFHTYCNEWGTGDKDNAGIITVQKIDDTDLCLIAAAANESEGSAFRVPDGHCAMLVHLKLKRLAPAAGVYASDEGIRFRIIAIDDIDGSTGLVAADRHLNYLNFEVAGAFMHESTEEPMEVYESGTWIHHWHSSKVNAGELYSAHLAYIIWKK